jgi:hypothetical protein
MLLEMIREDYLKMTGVELPISGGLGNSIEDPIKINESDPAKSAYWISEVVGFIAMMTGEKIELVQSAIIRQGEKTIEQYKIAKDSDPDGYYNYYFDISKSYGN